MHLHWECIGGDLMLLGSQMPTSASSASNRARRSAAGSFLAPGLPVGFEAGFCDGRTAGGLLVWSSASSS
jgi:hypothetical protein